MVWFTSVKSPKLKTSKKTGSNTPSGLWNKCSQCAEILQTSRLEENFQVCPYCDHHFRIRAAERIQMLLDPDTFQAMGGEIKSKDPLSFIDSKPYLQRLEETEAKTGVKDSVMAGTGKIEGIDVSLAVMDFSFMGGSMGVVAGEKIAAAFDVAYEREIPAIVVSCSGGARMQEGILSLMQLAKTSASRQRLRHKNLAYISVLTDPTTGGCAASFAMQGDLNLAEPNALIGFAGPRIIEQSMHQTLPPGFQTAEFLHDHGMVDKVIHRKDMRQEIAFFLKIFTHFRAKK